MPPRKSNGPKQQWSKLRRFERYETDVRVVVTPKAGAAADKPVHGRAGVIAGGGFGAILAGELEVGEAVTAELVLSGHSRVSVSATAIVRDRQGFRHGFEFVDLNSEQRVAIHEFCAQLRPGK